MRPFALRLFALAVAITAALAPAIATAQVVVLDDEVVLAEKPHGGRGGWDAPAAVMPADQGALNSELASILQSQPPLLPTRVGLPSRATLDVTAYPTMNRRTGLPCIGCRNPCRSFRYTYARPDRGAVTVEGQRCRRPNGRWVAFAPDTVIGQRPAAPGAPSAQTLQPSRRAERPVFPPPLPPARPGDGSRAIAGADADAGAVAGAPAPWDPPLASSQPGAADGGAGQFGTAPDLQTDEDYGPDAGRDLAAASPDVGVTGTLPEPSAGDAEGPLVLSPQLPPDVAAPGVAAQDLPPLAATPDAAAPADDPASATPAAQAAAAALDEQDAAASEAAHQDASADLPPEPDSAPQQPAEATAAPAAEPEPAPAVETQTARVVMPFGGNQPAPDDAVAIETVADPDVVRMLRMLRYLDPETSSEPSAEAFQAAVSDFAADERFALPLSNAALREKLETAVDRLAALSSCPATGVAGGYGVCLTAQQ
jgi:hypothetical protein